MNYGVPIYQPGKEPLPPGLTEDDRPQLMQQRKMENWMRMASESCAFKSALSGGIGTASFAYEDPMNRLTTDPNLNTRQKTSEFFKSTGRSMWRSGSGFAKVGALYSGVECCIEGFRAKNDMVNAVSAGFVSGAILARNSGPRAAVAGGLAFAAFSGAVDLFIRRESSDQPRTALPKVASIAKGLTRAGDAGVSNGKRVADWQWRHSVRSLAQSHLRGIPKGFSLFFA
ncbi:Import inner membrane translocase subunit tim22 [Ceratobasidium theobromae]|uniref:Mitochondrial import inner membrane translocase subunit TIM22 n=1 Tax=Ceratobasidium theobromae TaxID=1582974 RepID=A0A5N5QLV8_9AGAM|nr:Import inner membrane translocase subunit tim22 [Ceratobasidium theobromae]